MKMAGERKFRLSRFGVTLAGVYFLAAAFCVCYSIANKADSKGSYVLMQLPIAIQGSWLHQMGATSFLRTLSWPEAYLVIAAPTMLVLYGIGHLFGAALTRLRGFF